MVGKEVVCYGSYGYAWGGGWCGCGPASLVTTVTDMAGNMLTTMAANPILGIFIGVPIVGAIVGVVGILMRRRH